MKIPNVLVKNPEFALMAGVVVVVAVWLAVRGVGGVAKDVAGGAVNAAGGLVGGVAVGIGEQFGLPNTSLTQCEIDQAAGHQWAASVSCPASKFIGGLFS